MRPLQRLMIGSLSLSLVAAAAAAIRSQERVPASEWRYFGGNKAFTRYSPLDQINRDNVKNLRIVWRRPAVSDQLTQAFPDLQGEQLPAVDADHRRRHALHPERPRPGGGHRWRERQDRVGTGALRADARGGERVGHPRRGLLARRRRQRRQANLRDSRRVSLCAQCRDRQAGRRLRRSGAREPALRGEPAAGRRASTTAPVRSSSAMSSSSPATRLARATPARQEGSGARGRPRLRRAERQAALDVPRRAAPGRIRQRHLGERVVEDRRRSRRLESDDRRRRARLRLRSADGADRRRRTAAGGPATTCSPTRSSPSTRRPASASGISRRFITTSGNGRTSARRCSATSPSTAGASRR